MSTESGLSTPAVAVDAETGGRWYRGIVLRVYYGSERGVLRSEATGREYEFAAPLVEIRAPLPRIDALREGMTVGFDLSRTARGTQVSVIKVLE